MRNNVEEDDKRGSNSRVIAQAGELKAEQNGNEPRQNKQPRAITTPLHGLQRIDEAAVHPAQDRIHRSTYAGNQRGSGRIKHGKVRQEEYEIIRLYTTHQVETEVANTEENLQCLRQGLLLLYFNSRSFSTHVVPLSLCLERLDRRTPLAANNREEKRNSKGHLVLFSALFIVQMCTMEHPNRSTLGNNDASIAIKLCISAQYQSVKNRV